MDGTANLVGWLAGWAALSAMAFAPPARAHDLKAAHGDALPITLRVYDYDHTNHAFLRTAEAEATGILAAAGVDPTWVDCPISHANPADYPQCPSTWQVNDYYLRIMPTAAAAVLGKGEDDLGFAQDCEHGPACWAIVFYDRVRSLAGGKTAAAPVLLGRVMAHEVGHLLLGPHSHSRTGIMRAFWSDREFGMEAVHEQLFTEEQSRRMRSRLIQQTLAWQARVRVPSR